MAKATEFRATLGEIVGFIESKDRGYPWWDVMGLTFEGFNDLDTVLSLVVSTGLEKRGASTFNDLIGLIKERKSELAAKYLEEHEDDLWLVTWPAGHVSQDFNSDATYRPLKR
jgi:hypothetical protein